MAAKILSVDEAKLVRAAGGVVRRNGSRGAMRVAIVHRPGYDDWSFPKGKVDRGETLEETALREVEEETGLRCKLVAPLGCTAYTDHKGRDKVACYWLMDVASEPEPKSTKFAGSRLTRPSSYSVTVAIAPCCVPSTSKPRDSARS